jgi:Flp pilus assembly protein TadD
MADVSLFGLRSGAHHLMSVAIHLLSTALLFTLLIRMTRSTWPSAFVAFVFALHPLHVESVAWIAERKDVLSGLFWVLTMWAYVYYSERPSMRRYLLVATLFAGGLMAKPMLVTLPVVLLLLDFWPLRRVLAAGPDTPPTPVAKGRTVSQLALEKLPLLALSGAVSTIAFLAQTKAGGITELGAISLPARIGNAVVSYGAYMAQTVWSSRLAVVYPLPMRFPLSQFFAAAAAMAAISLLAVWWRRRRPYLFVGWFWFLGTLVPVIGLVQVGLQARADRYTYVPMIGLMIALAWGAADVVAHWPRTRAVFMVAGVAACGAFTAVTWQQLHYWQSTVPLFEHALTVTKDNAVAHNALGSAFRETGQIDKALAHYREATRLRPRFAEAQTNLGAALLDAGRPGEAMPHLATAIDVNPTSPEAYVNLGNALDLVGESSDAAVVYRAALRIRPERATTHLGLASALAHQHMVEDTVTEVRLAITLAPEDGAVRTAAGALLAAVGHLPEAAEQFREAIRLEPSSAAAHEGLGNALASQGTMQEAAREFGQAVRLQPDNPKAHTNLGSALASLGRFDEAIAEFAAALRLDPSLVDVKRNMELAQALRARAIRR